MGDPFLIRNNDKYCSFYKKFVVEELSLCNYPHMIHYGNCSVIGTISYCRSGLYILNNIKLKSLDKEYQIPNSSTSIILLDTLVLGKIPVNTTCEVYGESVLYDSKYMDMNIIPKTSKDLKRELVISVSNFDEKALEQILEEMKIRYKPAIRVHTLCEVDEPQELIECNLAIRNLKN